MSITTWLNGQTDSTPSFEDRALHFGDGLFETFFISHHAIRFVEYHRRRLHAGLAALHIDLDEAQIDADLQLVLASLADTAADQCWRLKYVVSRGNSNSGYHCAANTPVNRLMILQTYDRDVIALQQQGVTMRLCDWRLSEQPRLAGIKHLNRLDQVMARAEWCDEAIFEGLMADQQGHWIEGTMSNVFAVNKRGELITPALTHCGVSGVMRQVILDKLLDDVDLRCQQAPLPPFDQIDELFISNALIGIVAVTQLESYRYRIGPVTRSLQQALQTHG